MTKKIYTWLSLLTLLLAIFSALPVYAQEQDQTYIIKKGDTLWGISERFIDDPYYWPNLWANNPDITNPHLIYPGQKVRIYNGRLILMPTYDSPETSQTVTPATPTETKNSSTTAAKAKTIFQTGGSSEGFILADEKPLGTIIDSVDNRTLLTENDTVFLAMADPSVVSVGDTYGLYKKGDKITHPATGENFGRMMHDLGYLQVTSIGNGNVTARIGKVFREVERGAELYNYVPPNMEISLKKTTNEMGGYILTTQSEKLTQGQHDVVFVDFGLEAGLNVGNMLYITRPRTITEKGLQQPDSPLPDELLGAAIVIESHTRTAAALIIKSLKTIYRGDQVMTIIE